MTIGDKIRKDNDTLAKEAVFFSIYAGVWVGFGGICSVEKDAVVQSNLKYLNRLVSE